MKISLLLSCLFTVTFAGNAFSQGKFFSLNVEGKSIKDVLRTIEDQSSYTFFYNDELIDINKIVDLSIQNSSILDLLNQLFSETDISYKVLENDLIVIAPSRSLQQRKVTGTIRDANTDEPLVGVNIAIEGSSIGVVSDTEGKYSIEVPESNANLVFSYIGYLSEKILVTNQSVIDIKLVTDVTKLEEVVVVGYGIQKKTTLTGSVSNVKGDELTITPVTNVSNSLSGKLSGVFVTTGSSEPGNDGSTITIRGISTFGNSAPLVVVDGVPGRSLDRIDPNTIDNISVLKDASAAIYGAQAANGVILITTKRGTAGKPSIDFSYNQGFGKPTTLPVMTNAVEYATMINEIDYYNGVPNRYSEDDLRLYQDGTDPWEHPNTDWYAETLKPWSSQHSMNISLSGGSESFRYFISGSTKFQDGFYQNGISNYKQHNFTVNLDGKINEYISMRADVSGRLENPNAPSMTVFEIFNSTSLSKPTDRAYWPNGMPGPGIEGGANPVIMPTSEPGYNNTNNYVFNSNLNLKIDVPWVRGLSFNLIAALDEGFMYNKLWQTPWNTYTWDGSTLDENGDPLLTQATWGGDPKLTEKNDRSQNLLTSALLNYKVDISHNQKLEFLAGAERIQGETSYLQGYRRYYISTSIDEINQGSIKEINNGGSSYESRRQNYFGRLNYNVMNRYMIEFQFRYQGSYIFSEENRWGFFPGVSLGYVLSEENFWKNSLGNTIGFFKIRASYGKTGNDLIAPYQYLSSYYTGPLNFIVNSGSTGEPALYENVIPNENATWESATQRDIGFDAHFLKGALTLTADYFSNKRDDILTKRNASIPASAGLTLPDENIGKAENKGFDFNITYRNAPGAGRLGYQIGFNGVYSKNKLLYWDETPGIPEYQKSEGSPIYAELFYESLGVFNDQAEVDNYPHWDGARPGDVIFRDVNNDLTIDANDRVRSDKTNIPTTSGAISLNMQYKGFDFYAVMQGAAGAQRYIFGYAGEIGNYFRHYYDERWTEANPDAPGPRTFNRENEYWATSDDYSTQSTQFLYSTNYIRLKTIEIGYNLPLSVMNKLKMRSLRVYFSAYNLFTVAPGLPKGFDPEMASNFSDKRGYGYPVQKVLNFGITLGL